MSAMNVRTFLDPKFITYMVNKGEDFSEVLKSLINTYEALFTDVKALQELVYEYHIMGETELGYKRAMEIRNSMEVLSITDKELDKLDHFFELYPKHVPRELLHSSVMVNNDLKQIICSPNSTYREIEEIDFISPISQVSTRF